MKNIFHQCGESKTLKLINFAMNSYPVIKILQIIIKLILQLIIKLSCFSKDEDDIRMGSNGDQYFHLLLENSYKIHVLQLLQKSNKSIRAFANSRGDWLISTFYLTQDQFLAESQFHLLHPGLKQSAVCIFEKQFARSFQGSVWMTSFPQN